MEFHGYLKFQKMLFSSKTDCKQHLPPMLILVHLILPSRPGIRESATLNNGAENLFPGSDVV